MPKTTHPTPQLKHTVLLLISLYLAQGLPVGFITQALPAILREYQVSLKTIGWTGVLLAPWALKFLWAPLVDRFYSKKIGQSKSWILPMQVLSALFLLAIACVNPANLVEPHTLKLLFALLFFINLCGASHDIATDAFTTRTLAQANYSKGSAAQVTGYRLGLIIGGGVFLVIIDYLGWRVSFMALAGLILLNTLPIARHKEPNWQHTKENIQQTQQVSTQNTQNPMHWLTQQFGYFWQSKEMRAWLLVLFTFKITDGLSSGMVKPMMTDMGISLQNIGLWGSILGSAASLLGAGMAAFFMQYMQRWHALLVFNALQALTTGLYAMLAYFYENGQALAHWTIYAANAIEHWAAAMALVAMLSTVMMYARHKHAGSDFTFQVCMLAFFSGNAHIVSGYVAEAVGYTGLFSISVLIGFVLLLPLWYWHKLATHARK